MLATVVHVEGSSYRRKGARLLITKQNEFIGCVSGGCLERDLLHKAHLVLSAGKPRLVRYDTRMDSDETPGAGLGCEGIIDIFVEPLLASASHTVLDLLQAQMQKMESLVFGVVTASPDTPALGTVITASPEEWDNTLSAYQETGCDIYVETFIPPLELFVFGAGYDAISMAKMACEAGFQVTLVDCRSSLPIPRKAFSGVKKYIRCEPDEVADHVSLNPRSAVVLMTHNATHDAAILAKILIFKPFYIGLLGPAKRGKMILENFANNRFAPPLRFFNPTGLDIGAESPPEIALSILAELIAVKNARTGGFLKDREGPIHEREMPLLRTVGKL